MSESETFTAWVDAGALLSYEMQLRLLDVVGEAAWNVDLAAETLVFDRPGDPLVCRAQLLGSSALNPGSWLWGWANPHLPEGATAAARRLRELGEAEGVPELTEAERPLGEAGNDAPEAFWYRLTIAVVARGTGAQCFFRAVPGEGTVVPLLLSHPSLALPAPEWPRVVRVLTEGITSVRVTDHRRAVAAYAAARDLPLREEGDTTVLTLPEGDVVVAFDESGRLASVSGSAGAEA